MPELKIGKYLLDYDPSEDPSVTLWDDDELVDWWNDLEEARLDIDNSLVGEEITLEQWQSLWDFVEDLRQG